ncbi:sigma-70 family RNA polymerase sigma factor [Streptomyces sp. NPDC047046]|uniref:sigma-70 family RNA polymerase sigma factor n=1 Tax=Streptomyces sp. NPDC047046 TaxID=3155378 RepID=UPI00340E64B8
MTTPPTATDSPELLVALVREYRDALVAYAERMLGDHGLAEDVVQEATIRAWRNIDRFHGMRGSVRGWLFTVTRHLVVDSVRKPHARREVVGASFAEPPSGADGTAGADDRIAVARLLRGLSVEHRAVLAHLYLRDRSIKETAVILGVPPGTVKSRHHHALRKLRGPLRADAA